MCRSGVPSNALEGILSPWISQSLNHWRNYKRNLSKFSAQDFEMYFVQNSIICDGLMFSISPQESFVLPNQDNFKHKLLLSLILIKHKFKGVFEVLHPLIHLDPSKQGRLNYFWGLKQNLNLRPLTIQFYIKLIFMKKEMIRILILLANY